MPEYPNPKIRTVPAPPPAPTEGPDCAYAELDVTTNFSFLRGASHPDELIFQATHLGHRAIAITDVNTLAGVVRAFDAVRMVREQGGTPPQLIIGARLTFSDSPDLLVWPTDRAAYGRLCRLLTLGKRRTEKGECALTLDNFLNHNEGMLAAVVPSPVGPAVPDVIDVRHSRTYEIKNQKSQIKNLRDALGDRLSLAASCLYTHDDHTHLARLAALAQRHRIPLLATNYVHYHLPDRRMLQDILTCVRHGCTIHQAGFKLFPNGERYLKSPGQMARLFANYPAAIARTLEIASQCHFHLGQLRYEYPTELIPSDQKPIEYLSHLTWSGAHERYPSGIPDKVRAQIGHELKLIDQLNFVPYFLTVHDLVKYARSRNILCQGRGSAANSAVCYCLGVTSVDPARIDVLFERFVSAARGEPPDIDIDFEHERREEVIQYLYEKYGRERAGMTAEVISYRGRSAVRDVGKALGLSLDMVDSLAKRLDWWHRGSLQDGQLKELGIDPTDRTIRTLVDLTSQLLGFPRHLSQHVGGMVMTRGPLCELVPIENASMPNRTVIEWDKDDIDTVGILKVDALALGMLTCISKALTMLNVGAGHAPPSPRRGDPCDRPPPICRGEACLALSDNPTGGMTRAGHAPPLQLHTIPAEDPLVYDMICDADTIGVFQIESRAQMTMLPRLRPRQFYDLVIEVAIVRPGPIQGNMVHPYLKRRSGQETVTYPSEALRQVLEKTLGVPLFQEQAMRIAMVGAGFSADEADRLRKSMAAWRKHGAIDLFHQKIVDGMLSNGYTREFAEQCFLQIRGFGEYGFPESHAASFALLVYASCWIKRYHPAVFCAALLNSQPMGFYAPAQIVRDAKDHGVTVLPADINHSDWDCTLCRGEACLALASPTGECESHNTRTQGDACVAPTKNWGTNGPAVRLGFRQIKGLREAHAQQLIAARQRVGRFTSIEQFHHETRLPRHAIERLAEADTFSSLNLPRRHALWQTLSLSDEYLPLFERSATSTLDVGRWTLDVPKEAQASSGTAGPAFLPTMPLGQEVMIDYRTTSLSLKKHPVAIVRDQLDAMKIITAEKMNQLRHGAWVSVAGLVLIRQRPGTASGIVFETIEDETGVINLIVRPNIFDRFRPAARHAGLLHAQGYLERQGQVIHVMAYRLHDLSHLLAGYQFSSRDFH